MAASAATKAKPGPSMLVALVVLGIGAVLAVTMGAFAGVRLYRVISTRAVATPGATQRHLAPGSWIVYQLTGTTAGGAGFTLGNDSAPDLDPSQVAVTGPDGSQLTVYAVSENDTITRNSKIYTSAVAFSVPSPGVYTLTFNTSSAGAVLVTRSLGHTARSVAVELVALGAGSLLVVIGLVLLFVGVFRRQRAERPVAFTGAGTGGGPSGGWSPGPTPPGWYPDPQGMGTRWWDGTRWTEHRA